MPLSRKKVIIRQLTGDLLPGYLPPSRFILTSQTPSIPPGQAPQCTAPSLTLDLLDLHGRSLQIPLNEIKLICFVRDFNRDDPDNPERLTRRAFLARPRGEGLWLRLTFTTGDQLEGLASQDLTLIDALLEDAGLFLTPPDDRANTHRIYVPRVAIATLEMLAVINAPNRAKPAKHAPDTSQPTLFPS